MINKINYTVIAVFLLAGSIAAAELPDHYPKDGFQRVGTLDAIFLDRHRIVINDVPYLLSDDVVVHSLSSSSVPLTRLRAGEKIGYRMASGGRMITEIWLLPRSYRERQRR